MKICLTLTIIVCGLFLVYPVDIKGRRKRCFFYNRDTFRCPDECVSCKSRHCTSCKLGRSGNLCQNCQDGYYQIFGYCHQCLNGCLSCNRKYDCTSCIAGHTGTYCQHCESGYYLNDLKCYQCNTNCLYGTCFYNGGACIDGCKKGWSGGRCNVACARWCTSCRQHNEYACSCPFGHYGTSCGSKCSSKCVETVGARQCNETTGACNAGCVEGWTGSKCTEACDMNCKSCDSQNKSNCHTCSPGLYGKSCDNECSSNCANAAINKRQCRRHDGHCTNGCVVGWTGDTCTEQCAANCTSCYRQNRAACTSCKPGYYGPSCTMECSKYCGKIGDDSRPCQQNNGTCLDECVIGHKGDRCDVPCDAGCSGGCNQKSGVCQSCQPAYFGPSCKQLCNATCYDPGYGSNICHQLSGECLFDCSQYLCSLDDKDAQTKGNVAVIVGTSGSAVLIVLVVAAMVFIIFYKKRRSKTDNSEMRVTYENSLNIANIEAHNTTSTSSLRPVQDIEAHDITLIPSLGPVTNIEDHYTELTPAPVGPVYEELDTTGDVECEDIKVHYTALTPAQGPVYEELNTNDNVDSGDIKDHEVHTTSNYYNL